MKKIFIPVITGLTSVINVIAHGGVEETFNPSIFPQEYFSHGYYLAGFGMAALWLIIFYGLYLLLMLVIAPHLKGK